MSLKTTLIKCVEAFNTPYNEISALLSELVRLVPGLLISEFMRELILAVSVAEGKQLDRVIVEPSFGPTKLNVTLVKGDTELTLSECPYRYREIEVSISVFKHGKPVDSFEIIQSEAGILGELMIRMMTRESCGIWAPILATVLTNHRDAILEAKRTKGSDDEWYNRDPESIKPDDIPDGYTPTFGNAFGVTNPTKVTSSFKVLPDFNSMSPDEMNEIVEQVLSETDDETINRLDGQPINEELLNAVTQVEQPEVVEEEVIPRPLEEVKLDLLREAAAQVESDMEESPSVAASRKVGFAGLERLDQHFENYDFNDYTCETFAEFIAESYIASFPTSAIYEGLTETSKQKLRQFTDSAIQKLTAINWQQEVLHREKTSEDFINVPNWATDDTRMVLVYSAFDLQNEKSNEIPSQLVTELRAMLTADIRDIRKALKSVNVVELLKDEFNHYQGDDFSLAVYKFRNPETKRYMLLLFMFDKTGILYLPMTFTNTFELDRFSFLEYTKQSQLSSLLDVGSRMTETINLYRDSKPLTI